MSHASQRTQIVDLLHQHQAQLMPAHMRKDGAGRDRDEALFTELVELTLGDPDPVVQLLIKPKRLGFADPLVQYGAKVLLIKVLDHIDADGRTLYRMISSRRVDDRVKALAVHALGNRNDPALLVPLSERLQPGGPSGWLTRKLNRHELLRIPLQETQRAILFELGRQRVNEARPLIENLDQFLASNPQEYRIYERVPVVTVRAQLGDLEALCLLIDWTHGDEDLGPLYGGMMSPYTGLKQAIATLGGPSAVIDALAPAPPDGPQDKQLAWLMTHGETASIRRWAQSELSNMESDVALDMLCRMLSSKEWTEARNAAYALRWRLSPTHGWGWRNPLPIDRLRGLAADEREERGRRLWAIFALFAMDHDATEIWEQIPEARAAAPAGLPADVQRKIITFWHPEPGCDFERQGTDVRLLIEAQREILLENGVSLWSMTIDDEIQQANRYQEQLRQAGLNQAIVAKFTGTLCYRVRGGPYEFYISTVGPYCSAGLTLFQSYVEGEPVLGRPSPQIIARVVSAGFLWLDETVLELRCDNYYVQVDDTPTCLTIRDLLFRERPV